MKKDDVFLYFMTGAIAVGLICGIVLGWGIFSKETPPKIIYCKSYILTAEKLRQDLDSCQVGVFEQKADLLKKTTEEQKTICKNKRLLDKKNFDEVFSKLFKDCNLQWRTK